MYYMNCVHCTARTSVAKIGDHVEAGKIWENSICTGKMYHAPKLMSAHARNSLTLYIFVLFLGLFKGFCHPKPSSSSPSWSWWSSPRRQSRGQNIFVLQRLQAPHMAGNRTTWRGCWKIIESSNHHRLIDNDSSWFWLSWSSVEMQGWWIIQLEGGSEAHLAGLQKFEKPKSAICTI